MPQSLADELSSIPTSPNLGQSLERAHRFAREQSHRAVTLEHLLLALTEDAEAALILQSANIDLGRLSTEVSGYLGRLLEDMRSDGTSEPRPDGDLLRVMQAAASAAKQSRRRQIDGAIVLAAIVGDGKSPAAGMLKALGMTFEEAIRALQRANTRARLKPIPKPAEAASRPSRAPGGQAGAPAEAQAPSEPAEAAGAVPDAPSPAAAPVPTLAAGVSQSAEEILAAARARIQQRAATASPKIEPPRREDRPRAEPSSQAAVAAADVDAPPPEPADPAATNALTEAIEAAMTGSPAARAPEPARPAPAPPPPPAAAPIPPPAPAVPPAPPIAQQAQAQRAPWAPPPEPQPPPAAQQRPQQPQPPRPQPPLPARLVAAGEGPRRPPLPPQGTSPPPPGIPNRPPRAPWPAPGEHGTPTRPPRPNGSHAAAPPAPPLAPPAPARNAPHPQRGAGHADKGLLIESVPRRMRMGVPANAEVRIARDRIEALIATLSSRGSVPLAEQALMRALSVRLRAPGGDFWIEPAAPETQWVDSASSLIHDDYAAWRWTVVARRRGRGRLTLMVSARTVGRDGVAAETAPPDRVIEVRIASNYGQIARRWAGWTLALLAGALIGHFSEPIQLLLGHLFQRGL